MPIGRRHFLSLFGGGVVGTLLSPLPYKLLDDAAIWTQNWPWLPRLQRGPLRVRHTHCALCPAGCAVTARLVGDQPFRLAPVSGEGGRGGAGVGASRSQTARAGTGGGPWTGGLCAYGLGALHMPFHPARLHSPVEREGDRYAVLAREEALDRLEGWVREAVAEGAVVKGASGDSGSPVATEATIAVLDCRPGRVLSSAYRSWLASLSCGIYLCEPGEAAPQAMLSQMLGLPAERIGFDLAGARTILSFGAPLLEAWSRPGRPQADIIQAESRPSPTAGLATRWLQIRPGSERALALGIANVLVAETLLDEALLRGTTGVEEYRREIVAWPPERAAAATGLASDVIVDTARCFATRGPSLALAGYDPAGGGLGRSAEAAIWALNLLAGSPAIVGRRSLDSLDGAPSTAISPGSPATERISDSSFTMRLAQVPDGRLRLLILDASDSGAALPWSLIQRKMDPGYGKVVSLSPYLAGHAMRADLVLPAPAPYEALEEVTASPADTRSRFGLAVPIFPPHPGSISPAEMLERLGGSPGGGLEALLRQRVEALHLSGRGMVWTPDSGVCPVGEVTDSTELWTRLFEGACWVDDASDLPGSERASLAAVFGGPPGVDASGARTTAATDSASATPQDGIAAVTPDYPLTLMPYATRSAAGGGAVPPLLSKLYRESTLREPGGTVLLHPDTAMRLGLRPSEPALLETGQGSMPVRVRLRSTVLPDVVHLAAGPEPHAFGDLEAAAGTSGLDLCAVDPDGIWRATPARMRRSR